CMVRDGEVLVRKKERLARLWLDAQTDAIALAAPACGAVFGADAARLFGCVFEAHTVTLSWWV
ncbi:MAG: hypothetical protein WCD63_17305, partial [Terrimicrobiaceae bacterium]